LGTSRTISSVVRVTIGIMRIARATAPASAEKPFIGRTSQVHAKMPMMIEGAPFMTSARKRITSPSRVYAPYSAR